MYVRAYGGRQGRPDQGPVDGFLALEPDAERPGTGMTTCASGPRAAREPPRASCAAPTRRGTAVLRVSVGRAQFAYSSTTRGSADSTATAYFQEKPGVLTVIPLAAKNAETTMSSTTARRL